MIKKNILIFFLLLQLVGNAKTTKIHLNFEEPTYTLDSLSEKVFLNIYFKNNKVYVTIPDSVMGKAMLFARHTNGYKVDYKQVVWSKFDNYILLEETRIASLTGVKIPIKNNLSRSKNTLALFSIIKEESTETSHHIEITDLFLNDAIDWNSGSNATVNKKLSFIKAVSYLSNEVSIQTQWGSLKDHANISQTMDFSFFRLPKPMTPRLYDYRMGFFSEDNENSISYQNYTSIASISRWRLEKKYKYKKISTPLKPITFWLSKEIPEKWRPFVKAGILEWLPAFEAAGFKDALVVNEPFEAYEKGPLNSVNYSMVRWGNYRNVRGFEDASGATVTKIVDLRSGEILKSDILISSTLQELSDAYFIRCAPLDKRTLQYPFPEDLMGELIQSLVAHEAGHSFGFMDGNYGEYAYPFKKMRDANWLHEMGHTPSIMTYARHNYVVQPEDSVSPSLLIQKVGPTDVYNIRWAYTPFYKSETVYGEAEFLEAIIREQDSIPWYRYNRTKNEIIGPGTTDEVVENDDPIGSTELGLKNIQRVIELLPLVNQNRKDFEFMERLYRKTLELWYEEMRHVLSLLGGYTIQYKSGSQGGNMFTPIPLDVQEKALDFFLLHSFSPPEWLTNPIWRTSITYSTYPDQVTDFQLRLLNDLLSHRRLKRLEHLEDSWQYKEVTKTFMSKIQKSLFQELYLNRIVVMPRRQEIQKRYIEKLCFGITYDGEHSIGDKRNSLYTNYSKSLFVGMLLSLEKTISKKKKLKMGDITFGHLERIKKEIGKIE